MPSRSMKTETINIGIQSFQGTAASTFYRMSEVGVTRGFRGQVDVFEAANKRIPADLDVSAEWSETQFESRIFFDPMGPLLVSAFGLPTTTALTDAASYKHVWTIRDDSFPTRKFLSIKKGNSTDAELQLDNFVNQLGWSVERMGPYSFTGRMIGQAINRSTIGSNTALGRFRALARKTGFYMSDSVANLENATTGMGVDTGSVTYGTIWPGDVFSFNFTTADMSHAKWTLNPNSAQWDDYIEDSITPTIEVVAEANSAAMDSSASTSMMYALRNNSVRYIGGKVMSINPIVATDYYMFKWEAAVQLNVENMDEQDTQGAVSFPWRFNVIDDGTFALKLTLHNKVSGAQLAP